MGDALELAEAGRGEREAVLDVVGAVPALGVVRELVALVLRAASGSRRARPSDCHHSTRVSRQKSYHCPASSGWQNHSISICSNSRVRKMKLRGVTSLRNALPTCAMPNGTLHAPGVEHVLEVEEDALRRLRPQVGDVVVAAGGADVGLEHQVELARLGERAGRASRPGRRPARAPPRRARGRKPVSTSSIDTARRSTLLAVLSACSCSPCSSANAAAASPPSAGAAPGSGRSGSAAWSRGSRPSGR